MGNEKKIIEVFTRNTLNVLKQKLNLDDESRFVFRGNLYRIDSDSTFEEIGLKKNNISINFMDLSVSAR